MWKKYEKNSIPIDKPMSELGAINSKMLLTDGI